MNTSSWPPSITLDAETVTDLSDFAGVHNDADGEASSIVLWIGESVDDAGNKTYGLNASLKEYPEEGCTPLVPLDRTDEIERDAARYRWLREQRENQSALAVVANPWHNVKLGAYFPSGELLDAAVDAARRACHEHE